MTEGPTVTEETSVDVGITIGELGGHPVVVAAIATGAITTQFQLPASSAAQLAIGILAAAVHLGADIAEILAGANIGGEAAEALLRAGQGLVVPGVTDTARINGQRP